MNPKLPYYMAYPMPLAYDDEKIERRDFEYMKSLYPSMAKKILPYVEDECDRMEYDCSMMYDEYPDKLQLRMMCSRIYDNVRKHEKMFYGEGYEDVFPEEMMEEEMFTEDIMEEQAIHLPGRPTQDNRPPRPGRPPQDSRPPRPGRPPQDNRPPRPGRPPPDNRPPRPGRPPQNRPPQGPGGQNWLRDMVEVMLYQELYKRRCDNRRCRRKFY